MLAVPLMWGLASLSTTHTRPVSKAYFALIRGRLGHANAMPLNWTAQEHWLLFRGWRAWTGLLTAQQERHFIAWCVWPTWCSAACPGKQ